MKTDLVRIGNSRGIRIPKPLIEQCGLGETVEVRIENNRLIVSPERKTRQGWSDAFRAAGSPDKDEVMFDNSSASGFDRKEWRW